MQGALAANGSSIGKSRSADAVATLNPKGRTAFWHDPKVEREPSKSIRERVENDRQKRFRRIREESPTGC